MKWTDEETQRQKANAQECLDSLHDHLYGNEPECSLCGHIGPDTDPQPCISRLEAGELVHQLKRSAKAWEDTAARHARDAEWLNGLLVKCAPLLGEGVYTDETGAVKLEPFVSKIPEALAKKISDIASLKRLLVEVVEKNFVLEARLAGNSQEMAEKMGQEVRDVLSKGIPDPTQTKKETS